jgi:hypothetical protein
MAKDRAALHAAGDVLHHNPLLTHPVDDVFVAAVDADGNRDLNRHNAANQRPIAQQKALMSGPRYRVRGWD